MRVRPISSFIHARRVTHRRPARCARRTNTMRASDASANASIARVTAPRDALGRPRRGPRHASSIARARRERDDERESEDGKRRERSEDGASSREGRASDGTPKLVPYSVRVATPPPKELGVHRLPKNTTCGETIEVKNGWFIVSKVTTSYSLERGRYKKDGSRLDVESAERFFVNASLEAAFRAAPAKKDGKGDDGR